MPILQKLLVALMLSLAIYGLATPEQAADGRVRGFTGPADVALTGDYLTSTFCYCEFPPKIETFAGPAHYYQIEYYNWHLNATFILTSTCPQDDFGVKCVPSNVPAKGGSCGKYVLAGDTMEGEVCRTWPGWQEVQDHEEADEDKFCYKPCRHHGDDYIYFNKQKRRMSLKGEQGPIWTSQMETDKVCDGLCGNMDAVVLKNERFMPSHQVTWPTIEFPVGMSRAHGAIQVQSPEMGEQKLQHRVPNQSPDEGTIASKRVGNQRHRNKQNLDYVLRTGLAGGLAGCAAKTVVGPLDRVKILFQASNPQFAKYTGSWFGVVTAMRDINRQDGLRGLFRGHSATLLRIFPYAAIKFLAYEQVRSFLITSPAQETSIRRLLSGSLAGVTSVFVTYPLEVIRVRLAFETKKDSRSSLSSICRQMYNEHPPNHTGSSRSSAPVSIAAVAASTPRSGLINFYRGFTPTVAGMLPYAALAPYTTTSPPVSKDPNAPLVLKYWAELLAGGFAGLVSQTASYPLEVIRRRMQVGGAVGDGHRLGMAETSAKVWKEAGFKGFWVGLTIGYVKVVPMVAVSFFVYERMKVVLGV